jgi:uncharacterized protein
VLVRYAGREAHFDPTTLAFSKSADDLLDRGQVTPSEGDTDADALLLDIAQERRYLQRLVLNVANTCNLDCVYCYAQGGDYGGPREKMTFETGRAALDRFFDMYHHIGTVQFFGGEPLLNWKVIRDLCVYGWETADRRGRERPIWMMSTNGTVLNEDIIQMIQEFDIKVTVSCDGPPEITDRLRPMRSGDSPSRTLVKNVQELRRRTDQPGQIEGTYTALHVEENFSVTHVLDYVRDELGAVALHMPPNVLSADGPHDRSDPHGIGPEHLDKVCESYSEAVATAVRSLATEPTGSRALLSSAVDIIEQLVTPQPAFEHPVICPAGSDTIAVDSDGSVYPCFMFYRRQEFRLGHIRSPQEKSIGQDKQVAFLGNLSRSSGGARLQESWARRFLTGCAGSNYFQREHHGKVGEGEVALTEAMVAAAIVELAHLDEIGGQLDYLPLSLRFYRAYIGAPPLG